MERPFLAFALVVAGSGPAPAAAPRPDPAALAARIDRHLAAAWAEARITPAESSDDAAFLRRATLDLTGRVPSVAEVNAFLGDTRRDKRARLIERLTGTAASARHLAVVWRKTWLPQTETLAAMADGTDEWLAVQLRQNAPYDRIVRDLLVAPAARPGSGPPVPRAFLALNEGKPDNLAASAARAFLGVNLDCAQCHDHPFARWTRDQFWQTAAFFARPTPAGGGKPARLEVKVLNTDRAVGPRLLTDAPVSWPETLEEDTGRRVFAGWLTAADNPYFARNAVNRLWAQFFGTGLVEPLDDLSGENPASVPPLLDDLTRAFVSSGYDLALLTRAIVLSRAYQLSSLAPAGAGASGPRLFSRAAVRGLTGEQLYDSLRVAAGFAPLRPDLDPPAVLGERSRFAAQFYVERPGSAQRSILQSLSLMNGGTTAALTDPQAAPTLAGVAGAPFLDTAGQVDALFLAALGRTPTASESAAFVKYAEAAEPKDRPKRLADIFWALLNSAEFSTNH
ncbi:DUF1549 domain-containing protein [Frigoriglobus tundricola]|uniref:DUF1553 domain-containing protein n=1 Tax=Frigoriglobus tundricola TaxID=2774151 RepID=A0A6M5YKC5_9BACT|nr:DUF1549 domain-containing protein [Frigoriglobus tundricola]QJW93736.1 hypothetical protein FTUN_1247 [Frigoriglobus tundricola]